MKVLGIIGSRRKTGNTAILVEAALEAIRLSGIDTKTVFLSDYNFNGCCGCEGCKNTFECVIDDDMKNLYHDMIEADAIVIGSPTYFYNISSSVKAFFERCYSFEIFAEDDRSVWMSVNEVLGIKYAVTIAVCEQNNAEDMGMTSQAMRLPLLALGYRVVDTVEALKLFKKGEAYKNNKAIMQAKIAGEKLAKTLVLRKEVKLKINNLSRKSAR